MRIPVILGVLALVAGCSANPGREVDGTRGGYKHLEILFSVTGVSADSSQYTLLVTNRSTDTIYIPTKYTVMSCGDSTVSFDNSLAIGDVMRPGDQYVYASSMPSMNAVEYEIDIERLLPGEAVAISLRGRAIHSHYIRVGLSLAYNTEALAKRVRHESSRYITTNGSFWTIGFEFFEMSFTCRNT